MTGLFAFCLNCLPAVSALRLACCRFSLLCWAAARRCSASASRSRRSAWVSVWTDWDSKSEGTDEMWGLSTSMRDWVLESVGLISGTGGARLHRRLVSHLRTKYMETSKKDRVCQWPKRSITLAIAPFTAANPPSESLLPFDSGNKLARVGAREGLENP